MENPIIVITGPTASGKTALSLEVVPKFGGEILCVDSMTVYRGMDIGTDKPTTLITNPKDRAQKEDATYTIRGIAHHMLDILNPDEEFNVAICQKILEEKIKEIHNRGHIPFIVGGSNLYIDSFIYGYKMPEVPPNPKFRESLEGKTNEELFLRIAKADPDAIWTLDKNNRRRLIRALEVIEKSGKPFSSQKDRNKMPKNVLYLVVERERGELYSKINNRVDEMMQEGFLEEVKRLFKKYDHNTAMQAAGYKQLVEHLEGKLSLAEAIEKTKQAHRNFAKRQLTWLKRNKDKVIVESPKEAEEKIYEFLK